jgi:hypothetical protein
VIVDEALISERIDLYHIKKKWDRLPSNLERASTDFWCLPSWMLKKKMQMTAAEFNKEKKLISVIQGSM